MERVLGALSVGVDILDVRSVFLYCRISEQRLFNLYLPDSEEKIKPPS